MKKLIALAVVASSFSSPLSAANMARVRSDLAGLLIHTQACLAGVRATYAWAKLGDGANPKHIAATKAAKCLPEVRQDLDKVKLTLKREFGADPTKLADVKKWYAGYNVALDEIEVVSDDIDGCSAFIEGSTSKLEAELEF